MTTYPPYDASTPIIRRLPPPRTTTPRRRPRVAGGGGSSTYWEDVNSHADFRLKGATPVTTLASLAAKHLCREFSRRGHVCTARIVGGIT